MKTVHTERHRLRDARTELDGGELVPPFECPARVETILARIHEQRLGPVIEPVAHGPDPVGALHDPGYLDFLRDCWGEWTAAGYRGEAMPLVWPSRRMTLSRPPRSIEGRIGYYALGADTTITEGTWDAAQAAADVALTGADLLLSGEGAAFALCRPPGHHAARDMFGGYCFLNNAGLAAEALRGAMDRVAILDVDFHHGNGTQSLFWERDDILFVSLHGDPEFAFPWFLGSADEIGAGPGVGTTANFPLPEGCDWPRWSEALETALARIRDFRADALVISLGTDTFERDPISAFRLTSDDFGRMGSRLARAGLPTLFVMEGGYAIEEIGINTVNVLQAFEGET